MTGIERRFVQPGGPHNATPARIVFGAGTGAGLADEVSRLGATRALIVTTPGRAGMGESIRSTIGSAAVGVFAEAISQVPIELAHHGRAHVAATGADCLVSVGGGAATGLSKAIALEHPVPIIAVPTTYSGSEMTAFCGITIDGVKRMHASLSMLASTVVYDPRLTLTLPRSVSASSALNALAHCVDAVHQPTLSPLVAHAAVEGAVAVCEALPRVLREPSDVQARGDLLYGAFLSGAVLAGGFTLQHAVAHTLGGSFGIEHGLAHSLVLPHVARHLQQVVPDAMAPLADGLGTDDLATTLENLVDAAGLPTGLREMGLSLDDLERAVDITVSEEPDETGPAPVTAEVVRGILTAAYEGRVRRSTAAS